MKRKPQLKLPAPAHKESRIGDSDRTDCSEPVAYDRVLAPSQLHRLEWLSEQYQLNPKLICTATETWRRWDLAWGLVLTCPQEKQRFQAMSDALRNISISCKRPLPLEDCSASSVVVVDQVAEDLVALDRPGLI
jgi:hypothetical protein